MGIRSLIWDCSDAQVILDWSETRMISWHEMCALGGGKKRSLRQVNCHSLVSRQEQASEHAILLFTSAHVRCFRALGALNGTVHVRLMVNLLLCQRHRVFIRKELCLTVCTFTVQIGTVVKFTILPMKRREGGCQEAFTLGTVNGKSSYIATARMHLGFWFFQLG